MAIPNNDKSKEYARYALYCLNMVAAVADRNLAAFNVKWRPNG